MDGTLSSCFIEVTITPEAGALEPRILREPRRPKEDIPLENNIVKPRPTNEARPIKAGITIKAGALKPRILREPRRPEEHIPLENNIVKPRPTNEARPGETDIMTKSGSLKSSITLELRPNKKHATELRVFEPGLPREPCAVETDVVQLSAAVCYGCCPKYAVKQHPIDSDLSCIQRCSSTELTKDLVKVLG